jgi:hypothetical protein
MTHEPTIITEPCCVCYAVYGDYEGNAPDTWSLCRCATLELAKEVCQFITKHEQGTSDGTNRGIVTYEGEDYELALPCVESWGFSKSYQAREEVCRVKDVAKTMAEALQQATGL